MDKEINKKEETSKATNNSLKLSKEVEKEKDRATGTDSDFSTAVGINAEGDNYAEMPTANTYDH